jgi:hypothetical protein
MNKTSMTAAAVALAIAAATHVAASGEHRTESVAAAVFFAVVAVLQIAAAFVVLQGASPRARNAIVIGNVALVALWAWSRTTGLQFGPDAGPREAVGLLDLTAVATQLFAVAVLSRAPRDVATARAVSS